MRRKEALKKANITHVVSALRLPLDKDLFVNYKHHIVELDDVGDENRALRRQQCLYSGRSGWWRWCACSLVGQILFLAILANKAANKSILKMLVSGLTEKFFRSFSLSLVSTSDMEEDIGLYALLAFC